MELFLPVVELSDKNLQKIRPHCRMPGRRKIFSRLEILRCGAKMFSSIGFLMPSMELLYAEKNFVKLDFFVE